MPAATPGFCGQADARNKSISCLLLSPDYLMLFNTTTAC